MLPVTFIMLMSSLTMFLLLGRRQFDALLQRLHSAHPQAWTDLGLPTGFFWRPEDDDRGWLAGSKARGVVFRKWLTEDPAWMDPEDALARSKLRWFRVNTIISHVGFLLAGLWILLQQLGR